jgi:hypothetical protein
VRLREAVLRAGLPVFYSPHSYTDNEYSDWGHLNPLDNLMFSRRMFDTTKPGSEFHPALRPAEGDHPRRDARELVRGVPPARRHRKRVRRARRQ